MSYWTLLRNRWVAFAHDVLVVPVAWLGAFALRFNLEGIPEPFWQQALASLWLVVPLHAMAFAWFGLYRGVWRFASVPDLLRILRAVAVAVTLTTLALFLRTRLADLPRSVPLLHGLLLVLLLGGPRFFYRWYRDRELYLTPSHRVLIVGAGRAGEMLVRDLLRDPHRTYLPAAFVDDDAGKQGKEIQGIPVCGDCAAIPTCVTRYAIDLILIALPSASAAQMRRIVELCEASRAPFRTLPRLENLIEGRASAHDLRPVRLEDLLGREPVTLDWAAIRKGLSGQTVLVTGGGGSIGAELCRQIAALRPRRLVIFERNEFNLYSIEHALRASHPELALTLALGDVCDAMAVERLLLHHRPEVVFHAAAYKHVPLLEGQLREAVRNNVLGTRVLAQAASAAGCGVFVLISTDKAVNPANVMGATKRAAEQYCQALNARSDTRFVTVRFGNVLDSAGSVIPLFRAQIAAGGPVTVTDPDITRYFMTLPEACQLIMQAAGIGLGGETFVLDMGEPVRIQYLAEQMILLAGKQPGRDIDIVYTGLRPGEKLYEELFHADEQPRPTAHRKLMLARPRKVDWAEANRWLDAMAAACGSYDETALRELLYTMAPVIPDEDADQDRVETKVVQLAKVQR